MFRFVVVSAVSLLQVCRGDEEDVWYFKCDTTLAFPLYDCAGQTFEISEDTVPEETEEVKIDCRKTTGSGCEGTKFIINDVPVIGTIDCYNYPSTCKDAELVLVDVDIDDFDDNLYLRCGKSGDYSCEGMSLTLTRSNLLVDCPFADNCRNMVATLYEDSSITFMARENTLQNDPVPKIYLHDDSQCFLGSGTGVDWNDLKIYRMPMSTTETPTTTLISTTTTNVIPATTAIPTSTEPPTSTGAPMTATPKPSSTEVLSKSSDVPASTNSKPLTTETPLPTTSRLPLPTTTGSTLLPTTRTTTLPTAVEPTTGKPESTRLSTDWTTTFSTKKRTTANTLPTVSLKRNATIISLMTNTTNAGIEVSEDSSSSRRLVFSARMWLFFCGVLCLSAVGCTFIWTRFKRNLSIATEVMRLKFAISLESKRTLSHEEIVRKATSERLSRVMAAAESVHSSEITAVAPFNDEVVVAMSLNVDKSSSIPRSAEEVSSSNDLELCRQMATADVSEAAAERYFAEACAVGPFVFAKAGEKSAELTTTTTLSEQCLDEVEGDLATDGIGDAIYGRVVTRTEDDDDNCDLEAMSTALDITKDSEDCVPIAAKREHLSSRKPDGSRMRAMPRSKDRSGSYGRRLEEGAKKRFKTELKKSKGKRKKAAVDLSLLEASVEQRGEWTHSQWDQFYRAYECRHPEAYRRSVVSLHMWPKTATSCE